MDWLTLIAATPILVLLVLLVIFRWPARNSMAVALVMTVLVALFVWQVPGLQVGAAAVNGVVIALEIIYIILGALVLLNVLKHSGALSVIKRGFMGLSPDRRVQAIIMSWMFGAFLEGVAGFGTPGAIVGPLLVSIGFPAMAALTFALTVESAPVSFGALGTPLLIGVQSGLESLGATQLLAEIGMLTALIHAMIGSFIPLIAICMLTKFYGSTFVDGLKAWKFALLAGFAFSVPSVLTATFIGLEFPSVFGALVGLAITVTCARKGWLTPKDTWDFPPRKDWLQSWVGSIHFHEDKKSDLKLVQAWTPYVVLALLLLLSRLIIPVKEFIMSYAWSLGPLFGTEIVASFRPLYIPGFFLLLTAVLALIILRKPFSTLGVAFKDTFQVLKKAGVTMLLAVPMVQIFIHSSSTMESMPVYLAESIAVATGSLWPAFAAVIGAFGAFIAGSNTFSNMMFTPLQYSIASDIGVSQSLVVALQAVGGAAGNMISVHNVVAAAATVGLVGQEGVVIRKVLLPLTYYLVAAGLIGLIFASFL